MTVAEYEAHFHTFSRHYVACISIEFKKIRKFMNGVFISIHLLAAQFVTSSGSFHIIVDYAKRTKTIRKATQGGGGKKSCL